MIEATSGFWTLRIPDEEPRLTRIFPGEGNKYPVGTKVSVAAYTRTGKNITRIPLVIWFRYDHNDDRTKEIISDLICLLIKAFYIPAVLKIEYENTKFVDITYVFDDMKICKKLKIDNKRYIEQYESFRDLIIHILKYVRIYKFKVYQEDDLIPIYDDMKEVVFDTNVDYNFLDKLFCGLVKKVSSGIRCQYIQNLLSLRGESKLLNVLKILREFNNIQRKVLYPLYNNLKKKQNSIENLVIKKRKLIKVPLWSCEKDCNCNCGLKSPLHAVFDRYRGPDYHSIKTEKINRVPRLQSIDNLILLFGGCHILRSKNFFINEKQIHMGILAYILPSMKSCQEEIESLFSINSDLFDEVQDDIKSLDIRTLRKEKGFSSIISFSSPNTFTECLCRRSPTYMSKIIAFKDALPFLVSKYKPNQWKANILQFVTHEIFDKIFEYSPLRKTGFLERAIVFNELYFNYKYATEIMQKIAYFSRQTENRINISLDIDEFKKRFSYLYNADTTIFTKKGIMDFYITISVIFFILFTIIEIEEQDIRLQDIKIKETTIDKSCTAALMLIRERDRLLVRQTKKFKLRESFKCYLRKYPQTFLYHRDIARKYSTYSKETLKSVIEDFIQDSYLEEIIALNSSNKKEIIIYRKNQRPYTPI